MTNTNVFSFKNKSISVRAQILTAVIAIAGAVAIPQAFHAAGAALGLGTGLGAAFLPMHIPVILAAFYGGPLVGAAAGLMGPAAAHLISGMPTAELLPFMMAELCAYGVIAGLLRTTEVSVFIKMIVVMIGGRLVRATAVLVSVYALGLDVIGVESIWMSIKQGVPGIILQLTLIPLILYLSEKAVHE